MNNRYALVTGASSGIGEALAVELAKDNYNLVLIADHEDKLRRSAENLREAFPNLEVEAAAHDLTYSESAGNIFRELHSRGIEIDTLVNDAGVGQSGPFAETPIGRDIEMIRLNIEALIRLTKVFLPPMLSRNSGRILNVGSIAGFQPGPLLAVYHATKAFVNSFSEALAEELKDTGITVTALCPGPTDTAFFERADMEDSTIVRKGHLMDPSEVAAGGYQALKDGERTYIPGVSNKALTFARRVIPKSLQAKINKKLYESEEERPD